MAGEQVPGLSVNGPLPDETVTVHQGVDDYILDVAALTSNYRCIYGQGCQGVSPLDGEGAGQHLPADKSVTGCCRSAVHFRFATAEVESATEDSPRRIRPFVEALQADEAQHHEAIAAGGWLHEEHDDEGRWTATGATVGGNCIFLNTEMANGKTGCALYHLAGRLGVGPEQTRPMVCHTAPLDLFTVGTSNDGRGERFLVTLRPHWLGWFDPDGYFCTKDPAAFSGTTPAYVHLESELAMLLGAGPCAAVRAALDRVMAERGERLRASWGAPVSLPMPSWAVYQRQMRAKSRDLDGPTLGGS